MIITMFFALLAMAILFLILTVRWESLSIGVLDIILWFALAGAVHSIEIPYTAIQSDNTIVHGINEIQSLYPVSLVFIGIGVIMVLYVLINLIIPMIHQKRMKMM